MLPAARALGPTLTTLYLQFEKEVEAALGLPPSVHSYALLPIGYPLGQFGPVRRVPLADVVYEDVTMCRARGVCHCQKGCRMADLLELAGPGGKSKTCGVTGLIGLYFQGIDASQAAECWGNKWHRYT